MISVVLSTTSPENFGFVRKRLKNFETIVKCGSIPSPLLLEIYLCESVQESRGILVCFKMTSVSRTMPCGSSDFT